MGEEKVVDGTHGRLGRKVKGGGKSERMIAELVSLQGTRTGGQRVMIVTIAEKQSQYLTIGWW